MSHHLVEVDDLHYGYPGGQPALAGVSFRITHGEAVGIVGANGAGKSTLLLQLLGIIFPGSGSVRVGDWPVERKTLPQVRRSAGLIFQDPDDQLFMPTVWEDVNFGPLNQGLPPEEAGRRSERALETVGAFHLKNRPPYKLSGGEKRAAAIAAVLAMEPDILIMDEPSAGLDPAARRRLIELLAGFRHTKIIATHDLDLVLDLCPRTIVLGGGRVIADGPTMQIFADEAILKEGHLEKPLRMQGCPVCNKGSRKSLVESRKS
jgi:cobalt/nickel transport system ATP-binding protein